MSVSECSGDARIKVSKNEGYDVILVENSQDAGKGIPALYIGHVGAKILGYNDRVILKFGKPYEKKRNIWRDKIVVTVNDKRVGCVAGTERSEGL